MTSVEIRVLEAIAVGAALSEVFAILVQGVQEWSPNGCRCGVLLLDPATRTLRASVGLDLPSGYAELLDAVALRAEGGEFGTAHHASDPSEVSDVSCDPAWKRFAPLLCGVGLHAAWSIPIRDAETNLLGALVGHHTGPDIDIYHPLLVRAARLASIATARSQLDRVLGESELRYRSVAESLHEGLVITDIRGVITWVNPRATLIFGYEPEEMIGKHADSLLLSPDDNGRFAARMELRKAGNAEQYEMENLHKDGRRIVVRVNGMPLRDAEGRVIGTFGLVQDVTDQKQLAAEREAAEARYQRLVRGSPYGVFALDSECRISEVNPAGAQILERTAKEAEGEPFLQYVAEEDRAVATERIQGVLSGEINNLELELRVCRPSGEQRLLHLMFSAIHDVRIVGAHGVARDVTSDRVRERQLRRAERLASLGTLISGVAHELNNPLTSIKSFAQLMLLDEQSPDTREGLEVMYREAERAAKIVGDLRLVARQTQEEEECAHEPVDLNEVLRHVLRVRGYSLKTHNVELREDLAIGLPLVSANRSQIEQVLINLIVNAEQAIAGNSGEKRLIVRTRPTRTGSTVYVVDNGPGIATDDLDRIFDPFWTTKSPGEGTGLGLSLSHSIISEHGGEIRVESELGRGAAFAVELPKARSADLDRPIPASVAGNAIALRILIVDDEAPIRRAVSRFMARRGHVVVEASDGAEALRQLQDDRFDVILSDLRMPGMPGDQFAGHLAAQGEGLEHRLIFITGDAASPDAARILAQIQAPVIMKPFTLHDLTDRVELHAKNLAADRPSAEFG